MFRTMASSTGWSCAAGRSHGNLTPRTASETRSFDSTRVRHASKLNAPSLKLIFTTGSRVSGSTRRPPQLRVDSLTSSLRGLRQSALAELRAFATLGLTALILGDNAIGEICSSEPYDVQSGGQLGT